MAHLRRPPPMTTTEVNLLSLPKELHLVILSMLGANDVLMFSVASKVQNSIANNNELWRLLAYNRWSDVDWNVINAMTPKFTNTSSKLPRYKLLFANQIHNTCVTNAQTEKETRTRRIEALKAHTTRFVDTCFHGNPFRDMHVAFVGDEGIGKESSMGTIAHNMLLEHAPQRLIRLLTPPIVKEVQTFNINWCMSFVPDHLVRSLHAVHVHTTSNMSAAKTCIKGVDAVIVGFSWARPKTLENAIKKWIPFIRKHLLDVALVLVGFQPTAQAWAFNKDVLCATYGVNPCGTIDKAGAKIASVRGADLYMSFPDSMTDLMCGILQLLLK